MKHCASEIGRLIRLKASYINAVNTPKEHTCAIIVSGDLAYGQYVQALVGESIWLLDEKDYEAISEAG